jgi:hypothetical protein
MAKSKKKADRLRKVGKIATNKANASLASGRGSGNVHVFMFEGLEKDADEAFWMGRSVGAWCSWSGKEFLPGEVGVLAELLSCAKLNNCADQEFFSLQLQVRAVIHTESSGLFSRILSTVILPSFMFIMAITLTKHA